MTVSAAVKLIPSPPALVLSKKTKISLLQPGKTRIVIKGKEGLLLTLKKSSHHFLLKRKRIKQNSLIEAPQNNYCI